MKKYLLTLPFLLFLCLPLHSQKALAEWQYWVDNGERIETPYVEGDVAFSIDASNLAEGLHTLSCRVKDSEGAYSPLYRWTFLRQTATVSPEKHLSTWQYWVDNGERIETPYVEGDIAFSIDASNLAEGLHTLSCRVKDSEGAYSPLYRWMFLKAAKETNTVKKITWVRYWWNDRTDLSVTENAANDSSAFVFSGRLIVPEYAKTDTINRKARFNIVVGDDSGYFSPVEYADIEFSDEQAPSSVIEMVEKTAESVSLKWYITKDEVKDYNVYYSENDKPFILWMPNTTKVDATFRGQVGKTYRFTVTARDKFGNREAIDVTKCVTVTFTN